MKRILISSGEVSGDIHGALLVQALKKIRQDFEIKGYGGKYMQEQGVTTFYDLSHRSSVGIIESIPFVFDQLVAMRKFVRYVDRENPDLVILVDNQGFNMELAKYLKKRDIKILYYFPPHVSIWGKWYAKQLAKVVDYFFVPFYADYKEFQKYSEHTYFYGHPFFDISYNELKFKEVPGILDNKASLEEKYYFIMPGSRVQELNTLLPLFLNASDILFKKYGLKAYLPIASPYYLKMIKKMIKNRAHIVLLDKLNYGIYSKAHFGLMASGTATMESLLLGVPHIICYRVSFITFLAANLLVHSPYVGMSNILSGETIAPELLQKNCNIHSILQEVDKLMDTKQYEAIKNNVIRSCNQLKAMNKENALTLYAEKLSEILGK